MLKRKYAAQTEIPEPLREHYLLAEDGKWTLNVEQEAPAIRCRRDIGGAAERAKFLREHGQDAYLNLPDALATAR